MDEVRELHVDELPERLKYSPGDEITYAGAAFSIEGVDFTDEVVYSIPEGAAWKRDWDKTQEVVVSCEFAGDRYEASFTLTRRRRFLVPLLLFLVAALLAVSAVLLATGPLAPDDETGGDRGSRLIPPEEMTREEIIEMLNRLTELSMITVSVAPEPELVDGKVHLCFVVEEPNNGLSERVELIQDGEVVGRSDVVAPGDWVEWLNAPDAVPGAAVARVYAVDGGEDSGTPVSVEVEIK